MVRHFKIVSLVLGLILIVGLVRSFHNPAVPDVEVAHSAHKQDPVVMLLHTLPSPSTESLQRSEDPNAACAKTWLEVAKMKAQDLLEQMKSEKFNKSLECSARESTLLPQMNELLQLVCQAKSNGHRCLGMIVVYRAAVLGLLIPDGDPRNMRDNEILAKLVSHMSSANPEQILQAQTYADELRRRFPHSYAANHAFFSTSNLAVSLGKLSLETFQRDLAESISKFPEDYSLQQLYLETPSPHSESDWAEKAADIKYFVQNNPGNYLGPYEQSQILFHSQNKSGAVEQLQAALKLAPPDEQERLQRIIKRVENGDKNSYSWGFGFTFDDLTD